MLTLIRGGRVIDPGNLDGVRDILIEDDKIVKIIEIKKDEKSFASGKIGDPREARTKYRPDKTIMLLEKLLPRV